jgi:hypothetical protein
MGFSEATSSAYPGGQEGFSGVTGGRALSFHDLSMGETAAIPKGGMRRGQNSPVDKSSEKTSPGASERKKSFLVPQVLPNKGRKGPAGELSQSPPAFRRCSSKCSVFLRKIGD